MQLLSANLGDRLLTRASINLIHSLIHSFIYQTFLVAYSAQGILPDSRVDTRNNTPASQNI